MSEEKKEICPSCGKAFGPKNRLGASDMWSHNKKDWICTDCQERKFNQIIAATDDEFLAIYFCCLFFNRPFDADIAQGVIAETISNGPHWVLYLKRLKDAKRLTNGKEFADFRDGKTGIDPRLYSHIDKSKWYTTRSDTNRSTRWGMKFLENGDTVPFSDNEIKELDRMYTEQAAEYKGGMTQRVDMAIREICICRLEWKKCVGAGDANGAKKYSDMIKDAMTREGLRANDAKPTENMRVDSLIDRLEKKGAMVNGSIIGKKQLLNLLAEDHPRYNTSLDVVDAMMMAIVNTARRNNGQSDLDELPYTAQIADDFDEIMKEPTEQEKKTMAEIGVSRPRREGEPWFYSEDI